MRPQQCPWPCGFNVESWQQQAPLAQLPVANGLQSTLTWQTHTSLKPKRSTNEKNSCVDKFLGPDSSKCGPRRSSSTGSLLGMHIPGPYLDLLSQSKQFNEIPRGFMCILELMNHWYSLQNDRLSTPLTPIIWKPKSQW